MDAMLCTVTPVRDFEFFIGFREATQDSTHDRVGFAAILGRVAGVGSKRVSLVADEPAWAEYVGISLEQVHKATPAADKTAVKSPLFRIAEDA